MGGKSEGCSKGEQPDTLGNQMEPAGTVSPLVEMALCVTLPRPEEPSHLPEPLCCRIMEEPNMAKETTHVEVAWRLARASGPVDRLVTSSHGRPVTQAKYECKDLQDGKQE